MQLTIKRPTNWPSLKDEKRVYLVSPASGNSAEEISKMVEFLQRWNVEPILFDFPKPNEEPFLAQSDELRLAELKNALYGNLSSIILASRGGYGSARLLKNLLQMERPKPEKILVGFSDVTSLHLALNTHWSLPTLHAPVIKQCTEGKVDQQSVNYFFDALTDKNKNFIYPVTPLNKRAEAIRTTVNFAPLLGGNLSLIQSGIGTAWSIANSPAYSMLIEEVDEKAYAVDRALRHLQNAGLFNNCQALFVGDIEEKLGADNQNHVPRTVKIFAETLEIPVFSLKNIGHGVTNLAIPLGVAVEVSSVNANSK